MKSINGTFVISRDFSVEDYEIYFNNSLFGSIKKDSNSWRETYILEIETEDHAEFFVAMVLACAALVTHEAEEEK